MKPGSYSPEIHDDLVRDMHDRWELKPYEIADRIGVRTTEVREAMRRMGLVEYMTPGSQPVGQASPPKQRPNPLTVAKGWLGNRLVEKPSGFWLDGRPASLDTVMRASNGAAKEAGVEQITYSERWVV